MGRITYPIKEEDYPAIKGKCDLCGEPASNAYWEGSGITLEVCEGCAVNILPRIIADAVTLTGAGDHNRSKVVLMQVERQFWRALAFRQMREAEIRRQARARPVGESKK